LADRGCSADDGTGDRAPSATAIRRGPIGSGWAHLALALAGSALILFLAATREAPFSSLVPLALIAAAIAAAIAAGWGAGRVARRSRTLANVMLPGHVAAGIAAFFVLLAWVKAP